MSWFQVAIARERTGDVAGTVVAYKRAIELNPDYALALKQAYPPAV
jgi:cytochrome c-type biogenesis protein CcmH/NrfG